MKKIFFLLIIFILIAGCAKQKPIEEQKQTEERTEIANPASVYCKEQGGTLRMEENEKGQYGICTLPDGKECEEWAYFRGECPEEEKTEEKAKVEEEKPAEEEKSLELEENEQVPPQALAPLKKKTYNWIFTVLGAVLVALIALALVIKKKSS